MPTCNSPFFVWFTGRTGSTHLCDLLDSHSQIYCRKEDFCEVKIDDPANIPEGVQRFAIKDVWFTRTLYTPSAIIEDPSSTATLEYLEQIFSRNKRAAGFKLKFPNQSTVYPEVAERLKSVDDIKLIELTRNNVLKQSISLRNVTRLKDLGVSQSGNAVQNIDLEPMQLDVDLAVKHAYYFMRIKDEFHQYSQSFSSVLPVSYEELVFHPESTLPRILTFLDVDPTVQLRSKFTKTTPDSIRDAVANYEELEAAVAGTDLEQFLD